MEDGNKQSAQHPSPSALRCSPCRAQGHPLPCNCTHPQHSPLSGLNLDPRGPEISLSRPQEAIMEVTRLSHHRHPLVTLLLKQDSTWRSSVLAPPAGAPDRLITSRLDTRAPRGLAQQPPHWDPGHPEPMRGNPHPVARGRAGRAGAGFRCQTRGDRSQERPRRQGHCRQFGQTRWPRELSPGVQIHLQTASTVDRFRPPTYIVPVLPPPSSPSRPGGVDPGGPQGSLEQPAQPGTTGGRGQWSW